MTGILATLGFDTATGELTVAVRAGGRSLSEAREGPDEAGRPRHSTLLLATVERCVEEAGGWEAIGRIAVGVGPGSYTGVRIGIATARALGQARGLGLVGVPTVHALAAAIAETPGAAGRPALAVLDARRGQAFAAVREPGGDGALGEPVLLEPRGLAELAASLDPAPLAAGEGALRFLEELEAAGATVAPPEDAVHRVAARFICVVSDGSPTVTPDRVEPIYLREPDAKRWRERDRGTAG